MENSEPKKLTRSVKDRIIAGVCGGMAEYLEIDPIVIRILFIILFFAGGSSLLAYIILWIVIPESVEKNTKQESAQKNESKEADQSQRVDIMATESEHRSRSVFGLIIILIGIIFLLDSFKLFAITYWFRLWPVFLIVLGAALLFKRR